MRLTQEQRSTLIDALKLASELKAKEHVDAHDRYKATGDPGKGQECIRAHCDMRKILDLITFIRSELEKEGE